MPELGQFELLAIAKVKLATKPNVERKEDKQKHTRVNRTVGSVDGIAGNVEIVVSRRESTAGATKVRRLATMDSSGSILDLAQSVSRAVIRSDASIWQSLLNTLALASRYTSGANARSKYPKSETDQQPAGKSPRPHHQSNSRCSMKDRWCWRKYRG